MPVQLVDVNSTGAHSYDKVEKNSRQLMAEKLLITPVLFLDSLTSPAIYTLEYLTCHCTAVYYTPLFLWPVA